jgi:hypothetical protein
MMNNADTPESNRGSPVSGPDADGGAGRYTTEQWIYELNKDKQQNVAPAKSKLPSEPKIVPEPEGFFKALSATLADIDANNGNGASAAFNSLAEKFQGLSNQSHMSWNDPNYKGALHNLRNDDDGIAKSASITAADKAIEYSFVLTEDLANKARKLAEKMGPEVLDFMFGSFGGQVVSGIFSGLFADAGPQLPYDSPGIDESGKLGYKAPTNMFVDKVNERTNLKELDPKVHARVNFNLKEYSRDVFGPGGAIEAVIQDIVGDDKEVTETQRHIFASAIGAKVAKEIRSGEMDKFGTLTTKDGASYELADKQGMGEFLQDVLPKSIKLDVKTPDVQKTRDVVEDMFHQSGMLPEDFLRFLGMNAEQNKDGEALTVAQALDVLEGSGDGGKELMWNAANQMAAHNLDSFLNALEMSQESENELKHSIGLGDWDKLQVTRDIDTDILGLKHVEPKEGNLLDLSITQLAEIHDRVQGLYVKHALQQLTRRNDMPELTAPAIEMWVDEQGDRLDGISVYDYDKIREDDLLTKVLTEGYQEITKNDATALQVDAFSFGDKDGQMYVTFVDENSQELKTRPATDLFLKPVLEGIVEQVSAGISNEELHYQSMKLLLESTPGVEMRDYAFVNNDVNTAWEDLRIGYKEAYIENGGLEEGAELGGAVSPTEHGGMFSRSFNEEPKNIQKKIVNLYMAQEALSAHKDRMAEFVHERETTLYGEFDKFNKEDDLTGVINQMRKGIDKTDMDEPAPGGKASSIENDRGSSPSR